MKTILKSIPLTSVLYITTLLLTISYSGCSNNNEKIISEDTFVEVLAEILVVENLNVSENEKVVLFENVFQKNKTNHAMFEKTKQYYQRDPEYWIRIYTKAKDIISAEADTLSRMNTRKSEQTKKDDYRSN